MVLIFSNLRDDFKMSVPMKMDEDDLIHDCNLVSKEKMRKLVLIAIYLKNIREIRKNRWEHQ